MSFNLSQTLQDFEVGSNMIGFAYEKVQCSNSYGGGIPGRKAGHNEAW